MLPGRYQCNQCAARMQLEKTQVQVPRWQRRWWQLSEEGCEYRCPACATFHRLEFTPLGGFLYTLLVVALVVAWRWGIHPAGVAGSGLVGAALLFRHSVALRATSPLRSSA